VSHCAPSWPASPRALLLKRYCWIIHLFLRSMSALSLLLPLRPRKRIYQSRARPLLSESKIGREYPCLAGRGACLIGSRRSDSYWASLTGRADAEIWRQCQLEDRLLMTQDLDFSDARKFEPGSHAGGGLGGGKVHEGEGREVTKGNFHHRDTEDTKSRGGMKLGF
jgi:hypothetical protein